MKRSSSLALALLLVTSGCTKASESQEAKRSPKPPPPPVAEAGPSVSIEVEIDGAAAPPIDGARLAAVKPDYEEDDRRAWRIGTLLGPAADRPGVAVAVTGEKGITLVAHPPRSLVDPVPVLFVSRRGEAHFVLVTPGEPFPGYHGRGGRLARPGDPLPRINGVTKIRVFLDADAAAPR